MSIDALPRFILHNNLIQTIAHILPDITVPIFIQAHGATRMLQEKVQQPHFYIFQRCGELRCDVGGNEVGATGVGWKGKRVLGVGRPGHS